MSRSDRRAGPPWEPSSTTGCMPARPALRGRSAGSCRTRGASESIVGRPLPGRSEPNERPTGTNGNGGEHGQPGFEASPFRELLTEFRNLTERYGQALLALGESRGEVASLRTRVELIEARVDLRLPSAPPLVQWSPPQQPIPQEPEALRDRVVEPVPEPMAEAAADQAGAQDEPQAAADDVESSILATSLEEESI